MEKNHIRNEIVIQHNDLIEARYRLTLQEKRVMLWIISRIQYDDDKFSSHKIRIKDFANIVGVSSEHMYSDMEKTTMKLVQRGISIRDQKENKLIQVTWLSSSIYHHNEGIIELKVSECLMPYLVKLKSNFTKISLSDIIGLQSIYSVRIFELLKQKEYIGKRTIDLLDLKEFCGISNGQYRLVHDFKRFVLDVACKEITQKTDLQVFYLMVKNGRKFVSVSFLVSKKEKGCKSVTNKTLLHSMGYELSERDRLIEVIQAFGFSRITVFKMIQDMCDFDIDQAIKAVENNMANNIVRNPKAMLRTALEDKWKPNF